MENRNTEIAVIGALNIDITGAATVPFSSGASLPGQIRHSSGGVGWNIARDTALLGLSTAFFSVLGTDGYEPDLRANADACEVDISGCRWDKAGNNSYLRILDADGRTLASVNDMSLSRKMDVFFVKEAARKMSQASVAVAECNLQADALHRLTEELGEVPLVADAVSVSKCMRLENILSRIHTLKADLAEAERLTGYAGAERCATALLKKGVQRVFISLGQEGLLLADREDMVRLPTPEGNSINASGAGDAMTAALAAALARNMDLQQSARLALAAAAVTLRSSETVNPELRRLRSFITPRQR